MRPEKFCGTIGSGWPRSLKLPLQDLGLSTPATSQIICHDTLRLLDTLFVHSSHNALHMLWTTMASCFEAFSSPSKYSRLPTPTMACSSHGVSKQPQRTFSSSFPNLPIPASASRIRSLELAKLLRKAQPESNGQMDGMNRNPMVSCYAPPHTRSRNRSLMLGWSAQLGRPSQRKAMGSGTPYQPHRFSYGLSYLKLSHSLSHSLTISHLHHLLSYRLMKEV